MKPIRTFTVAPSLPPALAPLYEIAYNLHWAWSHDAIDLFRRLDSDLWEASGHNPARMLGTVDQGRLETLAHDDSFLAHLKRVADELTAYMHADFTWFWRTYGGAEEIVVAYFSAEFGLTESLSIFAGGLGILAGDHLKSASDLDVPLVGIGLLYQQGYFKQYLNQAGWQQEAYEDNDFSNLPLRLVRSGEAPVTVRVAYPGREVIAQVWKVQVGRVPLYLLDTNVPQNRPEDRDITDQLYGGDQEMRVKQEILLGIGGYRVLALLGLRPTICHMNEGHSAFLALERTRQLMERHGLPFAVAREVAMAGQVFTTHTPVPAGHDYFPPPLMERYFADYARSLGLSWSDFMALGRVNPQDANEPFCTTVLALRMSAYSNGVSRLHGAVTRQMWQRLWPGVAQEEVPIGYVTNGVHFESWISRDMNQLYERYLGPRWREEPADESVWRRAEQIAPEELWRTHERRRERLVSFVRRRLAAQLRRRGAPQHEIEAAAEALDPEALTIGFARRFATYKRATLLLRDVERLTRLVSDPERPVQFIFAGKAHPKDDPGKELIRQIVELARSAPFQRRLVFLEDYDMTVARYMLQGVDVWLNTPRRPQEASGTSGMKAAANGVINLSVLDGWWDEAYRPEVGWAIGQGEVYDDPNYQDYVEAEALYNLLEGDVIPRFYDRGADHLPRRWIAMMKGSLANLCYCFNTHRMVAAYTERFYIPAAQRYRQLLADGAARAKALAEWKARVQAGWRNIVVEKVDLLDCKQRVVMSGQLPELQVGASLCVRVWVNLGTLTPDDVAVQLCLGRVNADDQLVAIETFAMQSLQAGENGRYLFEAREVPCRSSGLFGYTVRVLPHHPDLTSPFLPGLITWA